MSFTPDSALRLDWCSFAASTHAVLKWHYSRAMPAGKLVHIGAWEGGRFIGAVVFGRGGNHRMTGRVGLGQTECVELTRVALREHVTPVSRIVAIALRMMCKKSPGIRCVLSYADPEQSHHGGIYQAMGWAYLGSSSPQSEMVIDGTRMHKRSCVARWGTASVGKLLALGIKEVRRDVVRWKHTYALGLDADMRAKLTHLSQPYPKRVKQATDAPPASSGGAAPTHALP